MAPPCCPEGYEIYNIGRRRPGLHNPEFSISFKCADFWKKWSNCGNFDLAPRTPMGQVIKTIYVPLTPKLHYATFEKNLQSSQKCLIVN